MSSPNSADTTNWSSPRDSTAKESTLHQEHHESDASSYHGTHVTHYPNRWCRYREVLREPVAEFLGVAILIIFGAGVDCQVVLSMNSGVVPFPRGDWLSLNVGWGIGTALGVWVSGGISGGHINPAITLAFATYRGFPWKKVPIYIFAQVMGGLVGAGLVYANYIHAIDIVEGGRHIRTQATASLFSTYALPYMTNVSSFFSEFLATAVLVIVVFAMTDQKNLPPPSGLAPLLLFFLVLGLGVSLGMETGYAVNPARDFGPRLFTSMAGYGKAVYTFRNQYWLWCPILAPILGAQAGAFFYDAFFFTGEESFFNKPDARARQRHLHAPPEQRPRPPAGPDHAV